jgi:hypothetical protein
LKEEEKDVKEPVEENKQSDLYFSTQKFEEMKDITENT